VQIVPQAEGGHGQTSPRQEQEVTSEKWAGYQTPRQNRDSAAGGRGPLMRGSLIGYLYQPKPARDANERQTDREGYRQRQASEPVDLHPGILHSGIKTAPRSGSSLHSRLDGASAIAYP
jgi:hypothetical protein